MTLGELLESVQGLSEDLIIFIDDVPGPVASTGAVLVPEDAEDDAPDMRDVRQRGTLRADWHAIHDGGAIRQQRPAKPQDRGAGYSTTHPAGSRGQ